MDIALHHNITFWSAVSAWLIAQSAKMAAHYIATRKIDFRYLVSTGGMPSAHSAMVSALMTSVAFKSGMSSPLFAVTVAFAGVVMFDAQSVRRAAGLQAKLLNQILDEIFRDHHLSQGKLKELLGHTRVEVGFGMIVGMLVGLIIQWNFG